MSRRGQLQPLASRGRVAIAAIVAAFIAFSVFSLTMSTRASDRAQHRAVLIEVMSRQRALVERYTRDVLLVRAGEQADPEAIATVLEESAEALLRGGTAPSIEGDDDEVSIPRVNDPVLRAQLMQSSRLIDDLIASGRAVLHPPEGTPQPESAGESILVTDPVMRLRVLTAVTENVALNAARTLSTQTDRNAAQLETLQRALAIFGAVLALILGWALTRAIRRQGAHFRAIVTRSTDLLFCFTAGGCSYVSNAVTEALGYEPDALMGTEFERKVHPDDLASVRSAIDGHTHELVLRVLTKFGDWRCLEAHVSDLRTDKNVRGVVLNARDVTERVRLEAELTHQAFHDGLSGLANRALFHDRLELALARSARTGKTLAVLLFDVDGFKRINDSLGHNAGDELLVEVGQRLHAVARPGDTAARLGGDEFAVLLEETTETTARDAAQRILNLVAEPAIVTGRPVVLTASGGIALHAGGDGDANDLMRHADVAMYAAKEAGRARFEVFRHEMARDLGEFLGLEHAIRVGLGAGEFSLHYQPLIDIETHGVTGVEALLRWDSVELGSIPPQRFIPIAEATGLIHALGEYVLRTACHDTAQWRSAKLLPESFVTWVNLSGKQLTAGGFPALVEECLNEARLPAGYLGLEITESTIVDDGPGGDLARDDLRVLHDLGIKIALDDFGTGFSSLGHLRRLPIDVIKVDRSFISGVERDVKNAAITSNLASLAHALGLVALAEGVETHAELTKVRQLGCDAAQGFWFAEPVPFGAISHGLASRTLVRADAASPPQPTATGNERAETGAPS